jgi:hypothetical protein
MGWRQSRSEGFTIAMIRADELHGLVTCATSSGCGISFGMTKDRSAVVISIFAGEKAKEVTYARSEEDVRNLLSDINSPEFMEWAREHQPV